MLATAMATRDHAGGRRLAMPCAPHSAVSQRAGGRLHCADDAQPEPRETGVRRRAAAFVGHRTAGSPHAGNRQLGYSADDAPWRLFGLRRSWHGEERVGPEGSELSEARRVSPPWPRRLVLILNGSGAIACRRAAKGDQLAPRSGPVDFRSLSRTSSRGGTTQDHGWKSSGGEAAGLVDSRVVRVYGSRTSGTSMLPRLAVSCGASANVARRTKPTSRCSSPARPSRRHRRRQRRRVHPQASDSQRIA